jgi:uncharacterized secreted repeat protein (TIGR03808 family)
MNRRRFLALSTAAGVVLASRARAAAPISSLGLDAAHFGLNPGSPDDQSRVLQRAIDEAARARVPLAIAPGVYRVGGLKLAPGAQLIGVPGATKLVLSDAPWLIAVERADHIALLGLAFDGMLKPLASRRGLLHIENAQGLRIEDCEIANAGGNAIQLLAAEGQVTDNLIADSAEAAIHSDDALGLLVARNTIAGAGNNGIQIWRRQTGDDGTILTDNRIENIANGAGGSGQYGNAVNVFRAGNVIVKANRIKNCAFSAVRGNAASNIHIEGNAVSDAREVALYAEFGFEGAVIANNIVEGAAIGVSVTNFNDGGRLAVVQGNLIRNLYPKRPAGTDPNDGAGIGIAVEADTAVTGNVIENAPMAGIALGFGRYLRDVAATANVVRHAGIGIAVSVAAGAGTALIANNVISDAARGAIVGMDGRKVVTGDLMKDGAERFVQLTLSGNRAS